MEILRGASLEIVRNWPGVVWIDLEYGGGKQDVRPFANLEAA
jgi:hypothetical protein